MVKRISYLLFLNCLDKSSKLLNKDACNNVVKKAIPLALSRSFDVCSKGCFLYNTGVDIDECPVCKTTTRKSTKILSIGDKMVEILCSKDIRDNLIQRQREIKSNDTIFGDIYDGEIFKTLYKDQILNNDDDILNLYLKIDIDGFTSSHSHNSLVMIHGVLLNLDSSERYGPSFDLHSWRVNILR